jgi:hypothetical protein
MTASRLSLWETVRPPRVTFRVSLDEGAKVLRLHYAVANETGEPIFVFWSTPPFVRITSEGLVTFLSLMPELTPWSFPIAPKIPPVRRLEVGEAVEGEATYQLPLLDTHPYPAGPLTEASPQMAEGVSRVLAFTLGYYPEQDGNTLWDGVEPGTKVPSYYDLKRQFLAGAAPLRLPVPIRRPQR